MPKATNNPTKSNNQSESKKGTNKKCSFLNNLKAECKTINCSKIFIATLFLLIGIIGTILAQNLINQTSGQSKKERVQNQQIKILQAWSQEVSKWMNDFHRKEMERSSRFFEDFYSNPFRQPSDPFVEMEKIHQKMRKNFANYDKLFGDNFYIGKPDNYNPLFNQTSVSQREDEDFLYYQLNFSGFNKDEIITTVKDNHLSFSGKKEQKEQEDKNSAKSESNLTSNFYYSFFVPKYVDTENPEIKKEEEKIIVKFPKIKETKN